MPQSKKLHQNAGSKDYTAGNLFAETCLATTKACRTCKQDPNRLSNNFAYTLTWPVLLEKYLKIVLIWFKFIRAILIYHP